MGLVDTIEEMQSDDYKKRLHAEAMQLSIRIHGLECMLKAWDDGKLPFEPVCTRETYFRQLKAMREYLGALKTRAIREEIDLSDIDIH